MISPLQNCYLELLESFGLQIPKFPLSVDQAYEDNALKQGNFHTAICDYLKHTDSDIISKTNADLELTGYQTFLNAIKKTKLVADSTLESIYCAEFPTGEFNACAHKTPHGYLCLFNKGMRKFIYNVSLSLAHRLSANMEQITVDHKCNQAYSIEDVICSESILSVIAAHLRYIDGSNTICDWNNRRWCKEVFFTAGFLSHAMRLFAVAHEIAHIECGHLDNATSCFLDTAYGQLQIVELSKKQEFEADLFAQEVLYAICDGSEYGFGYMFGGIYLFWLSKLLTLLITKIGKVIVTNNFDIKNVTHPSPDERIIYLEEKTKGLICANDYEENQQIKRYLFEACYEVLKDSSVAIEDNKLAITFKCGNLTNTYNYNLGV